MKLNFVDSSTSEVSLSRACGKTFGQLLVISVSAPEAADQTVRDPSATRYDHPHRGVFQVAQYPLD